MIEGPRLVTDAFGRVNDIVRETLKDLTQEELLAPPKPHIGWLIWHLTRVQDSNISGLAERPQAWITDGWHVRFGMSPEPRDYGSGHTQTPGQVDAFAVKDSQLLLDYHDAVFERTKAYLSTLTNADFNRVLNEPKYKPTPTVSVRLVSAVADNMRHAGQVEYLRGLLKYQGWFPSANK